MKIENIFSLAKKSVDLDVKVMDRRKLDRWYFIHIQRREWNTHTSTHAHTCTHTYTPIHTHPRTHARSHTHTCREGERECPSFSSAVDMLIWCDHRHQFMQTYNKLISRHSCFWRSLQDPFKATTVLITSFVLLKQASVGYTLFQINTRR